MCYLYTNRSLKPFFYVEQLHCHMSNIFPFWFRC
jgi:hypothetical protein